MDNDLMKALGAQIEAADHAATFAMKQEHVAKRPRIGETAEHLGASFEAFGAALAELQKLEIERDSGRSRTSSRQRNLPHRTLFAALFEAPEQPVQARLDALMGLLQTTCLYALQHQQASGVALNTKDHKAQEYYCALLQLVDLGLEAHYAFAHAAPVEEGAARMQACVAQARAGYEQEMAQQVDPAAQFLAGLKRAAWLGVDGRNPSKGQAPTHAAHGPDSPHGAHPLHPPRGPDITAPTTATRAEQIAAKNAAKARQDWGERNPLSTSKGTSHAHAVAERTPIQQASPHAAALPDVSEAPDTPTRSLSINFCDLRDNIDAAVGGILLGTYGQSRSLSFTTSHSTSAFLDFKTGNHRLEQTVSNEASTTDPDDGFQENTVPYHALDLAAYAELDQGFLNANHANHGVDHTMSESVVTAIHLSEQIWNKLKMITKLHIVEAASSGRTSPPHIFVPEAEYRIMYGKLEHLFEAYGTAVSYIPKELFRPPEIRDAIVSAYSDPHLICTRIRNVTEATIAQEIGKKEPATTEQPKHARGSRHSPPAWPLHGYTVDTPSTPIGSGRTGR